MRSILLILFFVTLAFSASAQNVPITQLTNGGLIQTTDKLHVARCNYAGCDYQVTVGPLATVSSPLSVIYGGTGLTTVGTNGYCIVSNGSVNSYAPCNNGAGIPGGSVNQIQYNNAGTFGGIASGSTGFVMESNGSGVPSFQSPGGLSFTSSTGSSSANLAARFSHAINVIDDCAVQYNGTDQTINLNACEVRANTAGVCMVFPVGTVTGTMIYNSNDCIIGSSGPFGQTIIKQPNSKNAQAVLYSAGSAALWGTNSNAGVFNTYISNITIDGNSSSNTGGDCIDLYGYNPVWTNVSAKNCPVYGIRTEYGPFGGDLAGGFGMEGYFTNIKIDTTQQDGWYFGGPHDSAISNVMIIDAGLGANNTYTGFHIYGNGNLVATNLHPWRRTAGSDTKYALWDQGSGGSRFTESFFEGADSASVRLDGSGDEISGGSIIFPFSFSGVMPGVLINQGGHNTIMANIECNGSFNQIGVQLGTSGHTTTGNIIGGQVSSCTGGAVDFTFSGGVNHIDSSTYASGSYPTPWVSTPASNDFVNLRGDSTGGGSIIYTGSATAVPYGSAILSTGVTNKNWFISRFNGTDYTDIYVPGNTNANISMSLGANGFVGLGSTLPREALDVSQRTGAIILPVGITGQRPSPAVNGMIRYNSTATATIEGYVNNVWSSFLTGSTGVSTFSAGTTGLTPSSATSGSIVLGGVLSVANGGTNASSASITAFNNITGYTAAGATGTTSSNIVFSASPTMSGTISAAAENLTGNLTALGSVGIGTTTLTGGYQLTITGGLSLPTVETLAISNSSGQLIVSGATAVPSYSVTSYGPVAISYGQMIGCNNSGVAYTFNAVMTMAFPSVDTLELGPCGTGAGDANPILYIAGNISGGTGTIGIGSSIPRGVLDISQNTGAMIVPTGATGTQPSPAINGMIRYNTTKTALESYQNNVWSAPGNGSSAQQTISYQPGLLTAVNATKGAFVKFVKASTVDNIEGSAITFSCVSNPTITVTNCHADTSCVTSPTTIGTVTVTAAGQAFDGSISNAAIAAGEYVAWSITAGTCASIDVAATAQIHSN